jgi:hypothetical protein
MQLILNQDTFVVADAFFVLFLFFKYFAFVVAALVCAIKKRLINNQQKLKRLPFCSVCTVSTPLQLLGSTLKPKQDQRIRSKLLGKKFFVVKLKI